MDLCRRVIPCPCFKVKKKVTKLNSIDGCCSRNSCGEQQKNKKVVKYMLYFNPYWTGMIM